MNCRFPEYHVIFFLYVHHHKYNGKVFIVPGGVKRILHLLILEQTSLVFAAGITLVAFDICTGRPLLTMRRYGTWKRAETLVVHDSTKCRPRMCIYTSYPHRRHV